VTISLNVIYRHHNKMTHSMTISQYFSSGISRSEWSRGPHHGRRISKLFPSFAEESFNGFDNKNEFCEGIHESESTTSTMTSLPYYPLPFFPSFFHLCPYWLSVFIISYLLILDVNFILCYIIFHNLGPSDGEVFDKQS
jgi:hypothetical protein